MTDERQPKGVHGMQRLSYRGKHYDIPVFDAEDPVIIVPRPERATAPVPLAEPIIETLNTVWNIEQFKVARRPVSLGDLEGDDLATFATSGVARILDMPIKFPDIAEYRIPRALRQFATTIQRIADYEHRVNPRHADYHAYLSIDQRWVEPGTLMREAPCHVDGFQGARWKPKCLTNHTYTVSDLLPTAYYVQPFDLGMLDEAKHDFFWEMNAQVADTKEAHRWQPRPAEITLMDCYSVHRGVENESSERVYRTWFRLSFEERRRVFDRLGNAHNPLFDYAWEMVERDIEMLNLTSYREDCDPTLRVFPWQGVDGKPLPPGAPKTKPRLR
jgi:hypothetical protein